MFNFSAGPAVLPLPVLEEAQADLLSWKGSGISVMEMSHRGPEFSRIIEEAEADLRALLSIPDNYKVLFLQGGASQQFAAIPLNLSQPGDTVDYVNIPSSMCNFHFAIFLAFSLRSTGAAKTSKVQE